MICSKCSLDKDDLLFPWKNKSLNKRNVWCKDCVKSYDKIRYETTERKQQAKDINKQARKDARLYVDSILEQSCCVDCGTTDRRVFEFDHLGVIPKNYNISDMVKNGLSIKTIQKEIDKCEVVCANCHRIRTFTRKN